MHLKFISFIAGAGIILAAVATDGQERTSRTLASSESGAPEDHRRR
ncbi:hypothetical protein [uncultured Roseobacter sp.]|nr:hypothetical protein [uncultured Roseobacter sp.]